MLRVGKVPPGDPTVDIYVGQNRFECLTCPYQFIITKRYYERKYLKKKEAEDILGGEGAWDNVDKTEGTPLFCSSGGGFERLMMEQCNVLSRSAAMIPRTGTSCRFAALMSR
jgi:hypothetical protein